MTRSSEYLFLQKLILEEKNYDEAIELICNSDFNEEKSYQELLAEAFFAKNNFYESATIYKNLNSLYKAGYCHLLLGDNETAKEIWESASPSPAQHWGLFFCELFTEKVVTMPTYLQIRSFLERDLSAFLRLNHIMYVQKIIDISEFLFDINPETNKIIARTFLYNNYPAYAKEYFARALDFTDQDAELYYLLGIYYNKIGEMAEAKNSLRRAIELNSNYLPAKLLLDSLKS